MAREPLLSYNIPFWSLDVRGLVTAPKRTSKGYVMESDHAHPHYEIVFNFSPVPVRHSVHGKYHETSGRYILWRAPYVLHSMRTLSDADYIRSQICFPPFVMNECAAFGDIGRLRQIRACTIPVTEDQLEYLDQMIQHMRKMWELALRGSGGTAVRNRAADTEGRADLSRLGNVHPGGHLLHR